MSKSQFVCWKDGLPVYRHRNGWQHRLGGATGAIPASRKHYPVPIERTLCEEAFSINVTRERFLEIRAIADATAKRLDQERTAACKACASGKGRHTCGVA